jgi:predicted acyltransferase (DUF342 family)
MFLTRADASMAGNVYIGGSAGLNVNNSMTMAGVINQLITSPMVSSVVTVGGNVSNDSYLNGRLYVYYDASINGRLFVTQDTSLNGNVYVGGATTIHAWDTSLNGRLYVGGDASLNSRLVVGGDVSLNSRLYVGGDVSLNSRLFINSDLSMNGNLTVGKDLLVNGNLKVKQYSTNLTVYTVAYNNFTVAEDMSLNGRLYLTGDASLNTRLLVGGDVSFNGNSYVAGNLNVGGKVTTFTSGNVGIGTTNPIYPLDIGSDGSSGSARLFGSASSTTVAPTTASATAATWTNNNISWTASASVGAAPYNAFTGSTTDTTGSIGWQSSTSYNSSVGTYTGSNTTSVYVNGVSTTFNGEWLQIYASTIPVIMKSYTITHAGFNAGSLVGRMPGAYSIVASSDGLSWYDVHDASFTALPVASATSLNPQTTSSYLVSAATIGSGTQNSNSNVTGYSSQTSGYKYFRMIITRLIGANFGVAGGSMAQFGWNIKFTPTSSSVLSLDSTTFNQLNITGGLTTTGNVGIGTMSPGYTLDVCGTINTVSQNIKGNTANNYTPLLSTVISSSSWTNSGITWTSSQSSFFSTTMYAQNAFSTNASNLKWASANGTYSAGLPSGSYATTSLTGSDVTTVSGEWIQIQSSTAVNLGYYTLSSSDGNGTGSGMPKTWWLAGSTDGTTWYPIQYCSASVQYVNGQYTDSTVINNTTGQSTISFGPVTSTLITKGYSYQFNSFTYFRLITSSTFGGGALLDIGRWKIYFNRTSSAALAMDGTNVNQLNITGGLTTTGNVGIGNTNPGSLLSFGTPAGNNKILTLYDNAPTDSAATATNFLGFGINSGLLRYQTPSGNNHGFYVGTNNAVTINGNSTTIFNGDQTLASTAASSSNDIVRLGNGSSSQFGALKVYGYRNNTGSDWTTTELRIQKYVDATNFGYIAFPASSNVYISSLSKGAGTFDIEHPLDASGRLVHSFVEGPRCDLIYRGVTQLQGGKATVNIDTECVAEADCQMRQGTFVALCANPMCYLQNNVSFDRVRGTIAGNILTILCENANSTDLINWLVIAERKDKYIKEWTRTNENGFLKTEHDEM